MHIKDYIFKPSTLILIAIIIIFIIMACVAIKPTPDATFMTSGSDLLKILGGAVAGAYSGEKYNQYVKRKK